VLGVDERCSALFTQALDGTISANALGVSEPPVKLAVADGYVYDVRLSEARGGSPGLYLLVSSGAIASGTHRMGFKKKLKSLPQQQAAAAVGQGRLMRVYSQAFGRLGIIPAQILLTMSDLTDRQRFLNVRNTLSTLMEWGVLPIINENDTVSVDELKFGDNDNLAAMMANIIEANLLINLTNTEGLYDGSPEINGSRLIPLVREITAHIETAASSRRYRRDGGDADQSKRCEEVDRFRDSYIIAHGKRAGSVGENLEDGRREALSSRGQHLKSKKHWIAFSQRSRGKDRDRRGARDAIIIREKASSLSVVSVEGDFRRGMSPGRVSTHMAYPCQGLVNYCLRHQQNKGLNSSRIEQIWEKNLTMRSTIAIIWRSLSRVSS
jgi:glutamate 5-kinase